MLPAYRKKSSVVMAAEGAQGAFLIQCLNGIRTIKSLALDARQRHMWDVLRCASVQGPCGRRDDGHSHPSGGAAAWSGLPSTGSYALGVYLALSTNDPIYLGALFAFLMLSQRVSGPLMQMAQLINQYDEARAAVAIVGKLVNQPAEEGRSGHGVRTPLERAHRIFRGYLQV